jgi:hypothetical protein
MHSGHTSTKSPPPDCESAYARAILLTAPSGTTGATRSLKVAINEELRFARPGLLSFRGPADALVLPKSNPCRAYAASAKELPSLRSKLAIQPALRLIPLVIAIELAKQLWNSVFPA